MKRILLVPIAMAILAITGNAAPVCIDNGTLQSYLDLGAGGCTIGDKLFSNFGFSNVSSPGALAPTAADIKVAGLPGDGFTNPGIRFSSGFWEAFSGETIDSTITFTVSAPPPFVIRGASLTSTGAVITGPGTGTVTETLNNGAVPIPGSPLTVSVSGSGSANMDFVASGGNTLSALNISSVVHVSAPSGTSGFVTISAVDENFSELAPEPVETILIGSGFLMLGLMWRKRTTR